VHWGKLGHREEMNSRYRKKSNAEERRVRGICFISSKGKPDPSEKNYRYLGKGGGLRGRGYGENDSKGDLTQRMGGGGDGRRPDGDCESENKMFWQDSGIKKKFHGYPNEKGRSRRM